MYGIRNPEELDEPVVREFESLVSTLKAFLLQEHNEDGTHKFGAATDLESSVTPTIQSIMDRAQDRGQWWHKGPWRLDDHNLPEKNVAMLRPPNPAAGTYHNYSPVGIDTAIGMEVEPDGDITITGLRALPGVEQKRLFLLRNRDSTNDITLTHDDANSTEYNRFDFPNGDDIVLGPGQTIWLYYDTGRNAWTAAITLHTSGGLSAGLNQLTGDVTAGPGTGSQVATIANDAVTFAKLQNITSDRLLGRDTAASGNTEEISVGGGIEFTGSTSIQTSAFTGDVTKSAGGTALTIANDAVTFDKMQNIDNQRLIGRNTAGTGSPEQVPISQALDWLGE